MANTTDASEDEPTDLSIPESTRPTLPPNDPSHEEQQAKTPDPDRVSSGEGSVHLKREDFLELLLGTSKVKWIHPEGEAEGMDAAEGSSGDNK